MRRWLVRRRVGRRSQLSPASSSSTSDCAIARRRLRRRVRVCVYFLMRARVCLGGFELETWTDAAHANHSRLRYVQRRSSCEDNRTHNLCITLYTRPQNRLFRVSVHAQNCWGTNLFFYQVFLYVKLYNVFFKTFGSHIEKVQKESKTSIIYKNMLLQ